MIRNETSAATFDRTWERDIYGRGQALNRYPYDAVVTFVYRNAPPGRPRDEIGLIEVGCGAGNNLWFAAREGFRVAGVDASESAIAYARRRSADENLRGDLRVGDFTSLPFEDASFDLAVDRQALTCCGRSAARRAVAELRRVLRPGGRFFLNVYSAAHTSASSGRPGPDGLTVDIQGGSLVGVGQLCFYDAAAIDRLVADSFRTLSKKHIEAREESGRQASVHAEWQALVEAV